MSIVREIELDLKEENNDRSRLMQKYSNEQQRLLKELGGSIGDVPMDPEHEYHVLQRKIEYLGRMRTIEGIK